MSQNQDPFLGVSNMHFASKLRTDSEASSRANNNGSNKGIGVIQNDNISQSLESWEKDYFFSLIAEFIGLRNVKQASIFNSLNFLQDVTSFSLGNLSPFNPGKIATGIFFTNKGNQK